MAGIPQISIVIPVFNRETSIESCVRSVLRAVPQHAEVIIVDDGSTDRSFEICQRMADEDNRITLVAQENSGWAGKPRNSGLNLASGEFVMFVDSDDALTPTGLKRALAFAESSGSDITLVKISSDRRRLWEDVFASTEINPSLSKLVRSNFVMKIWRRDFLNRFGLRFDEQPRRLEDAIFCFTAYALTRKISIFADETVYELDRFAEDSQISRQPIDWSQYTFSVRDALDPLLASEFPASEVRRAVTDFVSRVVLSRLNRRWTEDDLESRYARADMAFELVDRYREWLEPEVLDRRRNLILRVVLRCDYLNLWRCARQRSRRSALSVRAVQTGNSRVVLDIAEISASGADRPQSVVVSLVPAQSKNAESITIADHVQPNADGALSCGSRSGSSNVGPPILCASPQAV